MTSKMSKVIDAMNSGLFKEEIDDAFDSMTYVVSREDALKDLVDHWTYDRLKGYREGIRATYEETIWEQLYTEYEEMNNNELENEYHDTFDVEIVIE